MRRPIARLWGPSGTHVEYNDGLNYCIRQIRVALGDDPRSPAFIATLPRRGYRFVAPVSAAPARRPAPRRLAAAWSVAAALAASLMVIVESRPNNHHEIAVGLLRAVHDLVFSAR